MTLADQENQTQNQNQNQDQNKDQNQAPPETPEKKSRRKFIVIAVLILLVIGGGLFYWHSTFSEDTDDAQVDGDLYEVSSRVTGQVVKVYVQDNQTVQAGQAIADIDPKDYQVAFDQAQANLASAEADYEQAHVNVPITSVTSSTSISTSGSDVTASSAAVAQAEKQKEAADARVVQAKANALKAQLDVERYTPLVQKDVISKQQYDQAVATANADTAAVLGSQADVIASQEAVRQAQQKVAQSRFQAQQAAKNGPQQVKAQEAKAQSMLASVKQAQAKLEQARLNLGYCHIIAPVAGIVSKKNVDVGVNVSIGQDLLTVVPVTNLWVTANFKETQLDKMQVGQEVKLEVDALGGRKFSGKVTQVGGATGSRLSLFPPENATGNYVKVVQRIPVRIDFTNLDKENGDFKLRPGFSVTPIVTVKQ
ncbi:membrane fusion protein (multidrug efflux system) [Granulicella aggregans]|uniref:Membrane fusion protein (Multidrug efflux system) n=1 Tax=Granulicella aggregans TaxID=474949 RepID=A0A7W8E1J4_9BACT|nr:HlyD family secretion protein [Granulicella aggregans]MBB5055366.1 membrane fusion protein (multidrug efflux system) [Granulicella aggregans]